VKIGNRNFSPGLLPTLATALIIPLLLALGFWQLDRAGQKQARQAVITQRQAGEPLNLNHYSVNTKVNDDVLWRRVIATGYFDEDIQILLDNHLKILSHNLLSHFLAHLPLK